MGCCRPSVVVIMMTAAMAAAPAAAQSGASRTPALPSAAARVEAPVSVDPAWLSTATVRELVPARDFTARDANRAALLGSVGRDFRSFFSADTARTVSLFAVAVAVVAPFDGATADRVQRSWSPAFFEPGNVGGGFFVQAGAAVGTYVIGRATGSERVTGAGADLVRAQLLSQAVVQAGKLATRRTRPDGSNRQSLPSGHTASAFATAGVLQRHFGWKAGVPGYLFASYVGASRMAGNKHHLSDVLLGAGIGFISARVVTVPIAGHDFGLNVSPTRGGAAITFTPK